MAEKEEEKIAKEEKRLTLRSGLKREFIWAVKAHSELSISSPHLGRTRSSSRNKSQPSDLTFIPSQPSDEDEERNRKKVIVYTRRRKTESLAVGPVGGGRNDLAKEIVSKGNSEFGLVCDSCIETESTLIERSESPSNDYSPTKKTSSVKKAKSFGQITRKDLGLHKNIFHIGLDGMVVEYCDTIKTKEGKTKREKLLGGYVKFPGIFCYCCNTVISPSQFEAHAGHASRRKPRTFGDLDYSGMYCAVLTDGSSVVSVGLSRVMGGEGAELPLVATTTTESKGLGYFQALFASIERLLGKLEVKHFVLPAAHEAFSIWTSKFGFSPISPHQLEKCLKGSRISVFEGTSFLHKLVPSTS